MEKSKISIIIPVFNVEKYLSKNLDNTINQTYTNLEIILVDDGSTDSSASICDKYASEDARIKVIHKENGGSSSARNAGIEAATGDYIGFLDADDWPELTMYEFLYDTIVKYDCDIVECMSRDFDEAGNLLKNAYRSSGTARHISSEEDFRLLMLHEGDSSFCTKLFKASFMKQFRFSEDKLNEDFELILKMLLHSQGVYSIEIPLYNILIRNGSNQRSGFNPKLYEAVIENSNLAFDIMEKHYPSCSTETYRFRYVQRLMYLLHMPTKLMNKQNKTYCNIISEIRKEKRLWTSNPYLTQKDKFNLKILSLCPKAAKRIHKIILLLRKK